MPFIFVGRVGVGAGRIEEAWHPAILSNTDIFGG
jgi:hypothetical protein